MPFASLKGQDRQAELIKEQIKHLRLGRAYLFSGPEGIGKKMFAVTLAKALNCREEKTDPCDACPSCLKVAHNQHPDVHFFDDSDSGSIKIEDIRRLQREANLRPYEGRKKVFVIDNAHNLTPEAANALLKILEEPPKDCLIILISSKVSLLFKTIISRCATLKFFPMKRLELKEALKKDYRVDENLAHFLAFYTEGRLGVALKLKDTDLFREKNRVIDEFAVKRDNALSNFTVQDRDQMRGVLNVLTIWFRDVYLLKAGACESELINFDRRQELGKAAGVYSFEDLDRIVEVISDSLLRIGQNINIRLLLSNLKWSLKN